MKYILKNKIILFFILLISVGAKLYADYTEEKFWNEFIPAIKKLDEFYNNIKIEATCHSEYPSSKENPIRENKIVFFSNGALQRLDSIKLDPKTKEVKEEISYVATPKRSFIVARQESQKNYILTNIDSKYDKTIFRIRTLNLPFAAFVGYYKSLQELHEDLNVRINGIKELNDGQQSLVKVAFQTLKPVYIDTTTGWLEFLPKHFWAVRRYETGATNTKLPNRQVKEGTIAYKFDNDGFPHVASIALRTTNTSTGIVYPDNWTVTKIEPGPVDQYYFTPEAFGLHIPEPFNYNRLFLLLFIGTFLLVIGVIIWRWKSHKQGR